MYKCIFIDFDGTLVSYQDQQKVAITRIAEEHGIQDVDNFNLIYNKENIRLWGEFEKKLLTIDKIKFLRFSFMKKLFPQLEKEPLDLNDLYLCYFIEASAIDYETKRTLIQIAKKYITIIVSNGINDIQKRRIDILNLHEYIDDVVTSEEAGAPKPDPRIFELAYSKALIKDPTITKEEILMVGDSYSADVVGSEKWGIDVVWLTHVKPGDEGSYGFTGKIISTFSELVKLLKL